MNSKILHLLKSLDKKEIQNLNYFVNSPQNNKNRKVSVLMELLKKQHPILEISESKMEGIKLKVLGKKNPNPAAFRNVVSDLLELAESFLAQINLANNKQRYRLHLLNELNRRKLNGLFKVRYKEYKNKKKLDTEFDLSYYQYSSELCHEFSDHQWVTGYSIDPQILNNAIDELYKNFLLKTLHNYSYLATESYRSNYVPEYKYLDIITGNSTAQKFIYSDPYMRFNFLRFNIIIRGTEEDFEELFMLWKKMAAVISSEDNLNTSRTLENYCIMNINNFKTEYRLKYLEIIKFQHENKLYSSIFNSTPDMISVVTVALQCGERKWLEEFYLDIRKIFKEGLLGNEYYFKFMLNYKAGMLEEAYEAINKVKFRDHYHSIWVRKERLKISYELGLIEMVFSEVDSMKHFIKNAKDLLPDKINRYRIFTSFMERLLKLRTGSKRILPEEMIKELEQKDIIEKNWFKRMINELRH